MKWVFLLLMVVMVPALVSWLRTNRRHAPKVWMLLGLLPFAPLNLEVAPISWPIWPGHVKGMEVSLLDAVALAIILAIRKPKARIPFKGPFIAYFLACCVATLQANIFQAASFYPWQLLRGFLVLVAVVRACEDSRAPRAIVTGLVIGVTLQAGHSLLDRMQGALQTGGAMGHQNLLGLMTHFAAFPALALLLANQRGWVPIAGIVGSAIVVILTASRATIGLGGAGYVALLALSGMRRMTSRKATVSILGVVGLAIASPLALQSLDRRFEAVPITGDYDERAAFEKAAWMIAEDRPLGVGPNHYVVVANSEGYSARAGVIWNYGSRSAHVHHLYLLILAETGWLGLITFLVMIFVPLYVAFKCAFRFRKEVNGDLALGFAVSLLVVYIHSLFEWVLITSHAQSVLFLTIGLVGGVANQLGYWNRKKPARAPAPREGLVSVSGSIPAGRT